MWQTLVAWFHKWGSPKWFYQQSIAWSFYSGWLAFFLISTAFIYGVGFTMAEAVQGHSYRIIYMHVPSASLSMSIYVYMAILSVIGLVWKMKMAFVLSKACAQVGIGFAIVTFFTGVLWGEPTWGNGFSWDLRLYTAATLIVLYFAFIAMHYAIDSDTQADKATAVLAITTVAIIPLIKYSVEIGGLTVVHQSSSSLFSGQKSAIDKSYLIPLLMAIAGFYLMGVSLVLRRARVEVLQRNKTAKWVQQLFAQQLEKS